MALLDRVLPYREDVSRGMVPLRLEGARVGWLLPAHARHLREFPRAFRVREEEVELHPALNTGERRTQALQWVCERLAAEGSIPPLRGELYPVRFEPRGPDVFGIDRAASIWFGVRTYGVHLNGFVRRADGGLRLWVARRSRHKASFPGQLDNLAAGGHPQGLTLLENLVQEAWEEAAIGRELALRAEAAGSLAYAFHSPEGVVDGLMFNFDLELPEGFVPRNLDGQVEEFQLLELDEVEDILSRTRRFKFNCALGVLDFLLRRGHLTRAATAGFDELERVLYEGRASVPGEQ